MSERRPAPSPRPAWRRVFVSFILSQTLSLLGSSLVQYAIVWYVTLRTQSGLMMTLITVFAFLPAFFLSPFAGVWADRHDRKRIIMLADGGIALVTLALALLFMAGQQGIWLLLLASALRAVGGAIQGPAVGAILPQIVPEGELLRANGIVGTIQSTIMLVSPMASGALLTFAPIQTVFFIDVATAALAIGVLLFIVRIAPHAKALEKAEAGYFADMRAGLRYIREHRYLTTFFTYLALFLFMITPAAFLTPLQVTRNFGAEVWRLSAIEIAFSAGMMLGGAAISIWAGFRNRMRTMVFANLAMALCTIALGLLPWFWPYIAVMGIFGIALPFFNSPSATMIQEHVEQDFLGRVFSVFTMLQTSLMPLGMLLFGPLADRIRVEWLLLGTGAAMLAHGLVALGNRRLIETGEPIALAAANAGTGAAAEEAPIDA
ncbi:MAG TPA: MFS transporter [Rectinemataceae bacterium]|nr:MFS transporter [Rectinemataceae bacterium]